MASKKMALGAKRGRVAALLLAPIAVAVLFTAIATAAGDAPGSFSATGSMTKTRFGAAAARLPNGRVLIAGGTGADERQSAEIFKQRTGSFKRTGSMTVRRFVPAAAPLPNGRVLVAGGFDGSTRFSSAEIFAATNAFSFSVKGRKLLVSVEATGRVSVSDAAARLNASVAKKKKRRLLLKSSDTSGDPPTITVALHLSKVATQRLRRTGRVAVRARITFAPQGGLANTQTAKLKIKGKKKK